MNGETSGLTALVLGLGLGVVGVNSVLLLLAQPLAARPILTAAVIEAATTVVVRVHFMLL